MPNNKKQYKIIKQQIKINSKTEEYVFQTKNKCKWCWLLLLLLLLPLLLIRIGDTISYKLESSCRIKNISDKTINMTYKKANGKIVNLENKFNTEGKTTFKIEGRRIYERLFNIDNTKMNQVLAIVNSASDSLYKLNAPLKNVRNKETIILIKQNICITLRNIDRCTNEPIADINNEISLNSSNITTKISNKKGMFEVCGDCEALLKIKSSNGRYKQYNNKLDGTKTIKELMMLDHVDIPMEMNGQTGKLNFRLIWDNNVDVDFTIEDPNGHKIHSHGRACICGGTCDRDDRIGGANTIENIYWQNPPNGKYNIFIELHNNRSCDIDTPFKIIISSECEQRIITGVLKPPIDKTSNHRKIGEITYPF